MQAVFSRPVIAIGSDFVDHAAGAQQPFTVSCAQPGRFRWVTTTIARYDPDAVWPTDLNCTFQWNLQLISHDGEK